MGGATPAVGLGKLQIIGGVVLAVVILAAVGGFLWWGYTHPSLRIVNVTGKDGVTVTIDGEVLVTNLKNAAAENAAMVETKNIKTGSHKVESKDASGKVLDSFTFEFKTGTSGYVYAPGRTAESKVCFIVQTDEYKTSQFSPDKVKDRFKPLDPTKNIWELNDSIDYWFKDSPESVEIKTKKGDSKAKSVIKRALRQAPCDDPDFHD